MKDRILYSYMQSLRVNIVINNSIHLSLATCITYVAVALISYKFYT